MLILTADEPIIIQPPGQPPITVIANLVDGRVRLGFSAVPNVKIDRESIYYAKRGEEKPNGSL